MLAILLHWFALAILGVPAKADEEDLCDLIISEAWVEPNFGDDTTAQLNDPSQPFKSLNAAILAVHGDLAALYAVTPHDYEGVVYALPGFYGPAGNGESLPIVMKDRVHVQGMSAHQCIIRGLGQPKNFPMYYPTSPDNALCENANVLVSFHDANNRSSNGSYPWALHFKGDTAELFSGFTLQGGDVQVLFYAVGGNPLARLAQPLDYKATISNCLFDMRHNWTAPDLALVVGPKIGIAMIKLWRKTAPYGYQPQDIAIINNTFIMGHFGPDPASPDPNDPQTNMWIYRSRDEAVAILDVTDARCCEVGEPGALRDADDTNRGLGRPAILNNIFRTAPLADPMQTIRPFAMIGIDGADMHLAGQPNGPNCFDGARVGTTNGAYYSIPVAPQQYASAPSGPFFEAWDCQTPLGSSTIVCSMNTHSVCTGPITGPGATVFLWDGTSGNDPGFVGEFLSANGSGFHVVVNQGPEPYRDWRLFPGSKMEDKGVVYGPVVTPGFGLMANGAVYSDYGCSRLSIFANWDGEGFGNPRIVEGTVDLGFDEVHLLVMGGTYTNDSRSHNTLSSLLPVVPGIPHQAVRIFVMRDVFNTVPLTGSKINGVAVAAPNPPSAAVAWTQPPGTLPRPRVDPLPVPGYNVRYISFNNQNPPTAPNGWQHGTHFNYGIQNNWPNPITGLQDKVTLVGGHWYSPGDVETATGPGSPLHSYFNMQFSGIDEFGGTRWSNLQWEYR